MGSKYGHLLWGCDCGALNADIAGANLRSYTEDYDGAAFESPAGIRRSLASTVKGLEQFRQSGRWFDFGFGEGALLMEAERLGWVCGGVEVARASLEFGRSMGWDVREKSDEWPNACCDVVSLIEVLEHVHDAEGLLCEAARVLRPGGALVGTTPNIDSLNFLLLGTRWTIVAPPEHVTLFSAEALRRLIARTPLEIRSLRTTGFNPTEIMRKRGQIVTSEERNAAGQRLVDATSSRYGRLVKGAVNAGLDLFRIGDSLRFLAISPAR